MAKTPFDAVARARPHIRALQPYVPGEQPRGGGWTKLNTNENPYPPSGRVVEALIEAIPRLRLYPEATSGELRAALSGLHGVNPAEVIIGNGSDDLLNLLTRCFGGPGATVGWTVPSYSLYQVVAAMNMAEGVKVSFDRAIRLDPEAIVATGSALFFLTSPNAPTGVSFPMDGLREILDHMTGVLVVDEAYVDFGGETAIPLLREYENLIVVRTFSKSRSLAGARVGYALSSAAVIGLLDRVRDVYNVDRLAQAAALAALQDPDYFETTRGRIIATRERVREGLDALGWFTYPSAANFLFTEPRDSGGGSGAEVAADLFDHLRACRILVRYFPGHPLTCSFIRVSIGTDLEMDAFLAAAKTWLENA